MASKTPQRVAEAAARREQTTEQRRASLDAELRAAEERHNAALNHTVRYIC